MNFLAHFQLAWPEEGLIAGALEGDYHRGLLRGELPRELEKGIALHRAIDGFTDRHPVIGELRQQLPPHLRRYAGILIDLSFDHYLCLHWHAYSAVPRQDFNSDIYRTLQAQEHTLSLKSRQMLGRLVEFDILGRYENWDTVTATAQHIGERFTRHNPFTDIAPVLDPLKPHIERAFLNFYPDLQSFSTARISALQG